ncbi:MAG: hypothetical protein PWP37_1550 [Thermotogota bacterium]|nr:hypothetical protein [Thermotogota bacterium]
MNEFISELKKRREELGLTLQEAAWKFGVTQDIIEKIESGDFSGVELYMKSLIVRYCNLLGMDSKTGLEAYRSWRKEGSERFEEKQEKSSIDIKTFVQNSVLLTALYATAIILIFINWLMFSKLDEFRRYSVFSIENPAALPAVVETRDDEGKLLERRAILTGETVNYRINPGDVFEIRAPGGMLEMRLGEKIWKVKLERFLVEVKDGNTRNP